MGDLTPSTVRGMASVTIALCAIFYLFSSRAHPGAMRYVVSALPMIYAYAGEELLRWRRGMAAALAIAITAGLAVPRFRQAHEVAAGRAEAYATFAGAFDPRPVLREIESRGYRVCYADYWVAYKLEWVSDRRVRFIPYRSYDRRREESRRLAAEPGPRCLVTNGGRVQPFAPPSQTTAPVRRQGS